MNSQTEFAWVLKEAQEKDKWLARLHQVSSILLLSISLDQERLCPHWIRLLECWLRALTPESLSPATTRVRCTNGHITHLIAN